MFCDAIPTLIPTFAVEFWNMDKLFVVTVAVDVGGFACTCKLILYIMK
jgi:hypothetical protein